MHASIPQRLLTSIRHLPLASGNSLSSAVLICGSLLLVAGGCQKKAAEFESKPPLPVTLLTLNKAIPASSYTGSGSVKSWKTEQIGFEVSGRIQWVLEPGKDIDGRVIDPDGKLIQAGTPLAKIDPSRYRIAVESAEANLEVAKLQKEGIEIRLKEALPAELDAERANLKLAQDEFNRVETLRQQNAASLSEFDQAKNLVEASRASLSSLEASAKQTEAELQSAVAEIRRAQQTLEDAQRDLDNTTLFGSYQGQISEVMVVPGSVVSAGSPVLTLQMTNPIKIEVELSARQSRQMRNRRHLPISFLLPDGTRRVQNAFVYRIAPSADPTTRTFAMTMLLLNEKIHDTQTAAATDGTIASSEDLWPIKLNRMMVTGPGVILVEENSIVRDDQGPFVYEVTNAKLRDILPNVLKVRKHRITEHDLRVPFLGNWIFRSVSFVEPDAVGEDTLYVGRLSFPDDREDQWDGESVVLVAGSQWMLRPGDLVTVDLSSNAIEPGYYVPIEAVYEESGKTSLFVFDDGKAKQLAVEMITPENLDAGSLVQVQSPDLFDGIQVIVGGVHYLQNGQAVRRTGRHRVDTLPAATGDSDTPVGEDDSIDDTNSNSQSSDQQPAANTEAR
ncbi:efflux RND transporter periplasmic adaptor subunit [Rosistilla oblonga]|uniref:efflux RND transporter periplasmic adaptor subunit n=1 Tax=Rosistilla oblonga TaxID=2527990 RepID=UPI003A9726F3